MDEIKLNQWKVRFEQDVKNIQIDYNAFFLKQPIDQVYSINLDESNEWQLQINDNIPNEIKSTLQQLFLAAKPEDSI